MRRGRWGRVGDPGNADTDGGVMNEKDYLSLNTTYQGHGLNSQINGQNQFSNQIKRCVWIVVEDNGRDGHSAPLAAFATKALAEAYKDGANSVSYKINAMKVVELEIREAR